MDALSFVEVFFRESLKTAKSMYIVHIMQDVLAGCWNSRCELIKKRKRNANHKCKKKKNIVQSVSMNRNLQHSLFWMAVSFATRGCSPHHQHWGSQDCVPRLVGYNWLTLEAPWLSVSISCDWLCSYQCPKNSIDFVFLHHRGDLIIPSGWSKQIGRASCRERV